MRITNTLLRHKLSDLRVKLIFAKLSVCPPDWKKFEFIPEYNKFYYICDGNGWIKIGGKLFQPQPGQLFFAPAGIMQSFSVTSGRPFTMYWCHFTSNIGFNQLFQSLGIPNIITVNDCSGLLGYFQQLIDNRRDLGSTTPIKIQSALFEMIAYFIDNAIIKPHEGVEFSSLSKLVDTIKYIDENLDKEITINELSQTAHFHPNYFIRFFKTHLGMPPMRYIYQRRIEKAKELLVSSIALSINEVALSTGFNDASHFSVSFKKHVGESPSEYRNLFIGSDHVGP